MAWSRRRRARRGVPGPGLRSLIVPIAVGSLLAYVCYPLVARLERYRVTRGLAIGLLVLGFFSAALVLTIRIRAGMSSEIGTLDFKTRALHKLNERYEALMGLDAIAERQSALPVRARRSRSRGRSDQRSPRVDDGGALTIPGGALRRSRRRCWTMTARTSRPSSGAAFRPPLGRVREGGRPPGARPKPEKRLSPLWGRFSRRGSSRPWSSCFSSAIPARSSVAF